MSRLLLFVCLTFLGLGLVFAQDTAQNIPVFNIATSTSGLCSPSSGCTVQSTLSFPLTGDYGARTIRHCSFQWFHAAAPSSSNSERSWVSISLTVPNRISNDTEDNLGYDAASVQWAVYHSDSPTVPPFTQLLDASVTSPISFVITDLSTADAVIQKQGVYNEYCEDPSTHYWLLVYSSTEEILNYDVSFKFGTAPLERTFSSSQRVSNITSQSLPTLNCQFGSDCYPSGPDQNSRDIWGNEPLNFNHHHLPISVAKSWLPTGQADHLFGAAIRVTIDFWDLAVDDEWAVGYQFDRMACQVGPLMNVSTYSFDITDCPACHSECNNQSCPFFSEDIYFALELPQTIGANSNYSYQMTFEWINLPEVEIVGTTFPAAYNRRLARDEPHYYQWTVSAENENSLMVVSIEGVIKSAAFPVRAALSQPFSSPSVDNCYAAEYDNCPSDDTCNIVVYPCFLEADQVYYLTVYRADDASPDFAEYAVTISFVADPASTPIDISSLTPSLDVDQIPSTVAGPFVSMSSVEEFEYNHYTYVIPADLYASDTLFMTIELYANLAHDEVTVFVNTDAPAGSNNLRQFTPFGAPCTSDGCYDNIPEFTCTTRGTEPTYYSDPADFTPFDPSIGLCRIKLQKCYLPPVETTYYISVFGNSKRGFDQDGEFGIGHDNTYSTDSHYTLTVYLGEATPLFDRFTLAGAVYPPWSDTVASWNAENVDLVHYYFKVGDDADDDGSLDDEDIRLPRALDIRVRIADVTNGFVNAYIAHDCMAGECPCYTSIDRCRPEDFVNNVCDLVVPWCVYQEGVYWVSVAGLHTAREFDAAGEQINPVRPIGYTVTPYIEAGSEPILLSVTQRDIQQVETGTLSFAESNYYKLDFEYENAFAADDQLRVQIKWVHKDASTSSLGDSVGLRLKRDVYPTSSCYEFECHSQVTAERSTDLTGTYSYCVIQLSPCQFEEGEWYLEVFGNSTTADEAQYTLTLLVDESIVTDLIIGTPIRNFVFDQAYAHYRVTYERRESSTSSLVAQLYVNRDIREDIYFFVNRDSKAGRQIDCFDYERLPCQTTFYFSDYSSSAPTNLYEDRETCVYEFLACEMAVGVNTFYFAVYPREIHDYIDATGNLYGDQSIEFTLQILVTNDQTYDFDNSLLTTATDFTIIEGWPFTGTVFQYASNVEQTQNFYSVSATILPRVQQGQISMVQHEYLSVFVGNIQHGTVVVYKSEESRAVASCPCPNGEVWGSGSEDRAIDYHYCHMFGQSATFTVFLAVRAEAQTVFHNSISYTLRASVSRIQQQQPALTVNSLVPLVFTPTALDTSFTFVMPAVQVGSDRFIEDNRLIKVTTTSEQVYINIDDDASGDCYLSECSGADCVMLIPPCSNIHSGTFYLTFKSPDLNEISVLVEVIEPTPQYDSNTATLSSNTPQALLDHPVFYWTSESDVNSPLPELTSENQNLVFVLTVTGSHPDDIWVTQTPSASADTTTTWPRSIYDTDQLKCGAASCNSCVVKPGDGQCYIEYGLCDKPATDVNRIQSLVQSSTGAPLLPGVGVSFEMFWKPYNGYGVAVDLASLEFGDIVTSIPAYGYSTILLAQIDDEDIEFRRTFTFRFDIDKSVEYYVYHADSPVNGPVHCLPSVLPGICSVDSSLNDLTCILTACDYCSNTGNYYLTLRNPGPIDVTDSRANVTFSASESQTNVYSNQLSTPVSIPDVGIVSVQIPISQMGESFLNGNIIIYRYPVSYVATDIVYIPALGESLIFTFTNPNNLTDVEVSIGWATPCSGMTVICNLDGPTDSNTCVWQYSPCGMEDVPQQPFVFRVYHPSTPVDYNASASAISMSIERSRATLISVVASSTNIVSGSFTISTPPNSDFSSSSSSSSFSFSSSSSDSSSDSFVTLFFTHWIEFDLSSVNYSTSIAFPTLTITGAPNTFACGRAPYLDPGIYENLFVCGSCASDRTLMIEVTTFFNPLNTTVTNITWEVDLGYPTEDVSSGAAITLALPSSASGVVSYNLLAGVYTFDPRTDAAFTNWMSSVTIPEVEDFENGFRSIYPSVIVNATSATAGAELYIWPSNDCQSSSVCFMNPSCAAATQPFNSDWENSPYVDMSSKWFLRLSADANITLRYLNPLFTQPTWDADNSFHDVREIWGASAHSYDRQNILTTNMHVYMFDTEEYLDNGFRELQIRVTPSSCSPDLRVYTDMIVDVDNQMKPDNHYLPTQDSNPFPLSTWVTVSRQNFHAGRFYITVTAPVNFSYPADPLYEVVPGRYEIEAQLRDTVYTEISKECIHVAQSPHLYVDFDGQPFGTEVTFWVDVTESEQFATGSGYGPNSFDYALRVSSNTLSAPLSCSAEVDNSIHFTYGGGCARFLCAVTVPTCEFENTRYYLDVPFLGSFVWVTYDTKYVPLAQLSASTVSSVQWSGEVNRRATSLKDASRVAQFYKVSVDDPDEMHAVVVRARVLNQPHATIELLISPALHGRCDLSASETPFTVSNYQYGDACSAGQWTFNHVINCFTSFEDFYITVFSLQDLSVYSDLVQYDLEVELLTPMRSLPLCTEVCGALNGPNAVELFQLELDGWTDTEIAYALPYSETNIAYSVGSQFPAEVFSAEPQVSIQPPCSSAQPSANNTFVAVWMDDSLSPDCDFQYTYSVSVCLTKPVFIPITYDQEYCAQMTALSPDLYFLFTSNSGDVFDLKSSPDVLVSISPRSFGPGGPWFNQPCESGLFTQVTEWIIRMSYNGIPAPGSTLEVRKLLDISAPLTLSALDYTPVGSKQVTVFNFSAQNWVRSIDVFAELNIDGVWEVPSVTAYLSSSFCPLLPSRVPTVGLMKWSFDIPSQISSDVLYLIFTYGSCVHSFEVMPAVVPPESLTAFTPISVSLPRLSPWSTGSPWRSIEFLDMECLESSSYSYTMSQTGPLQLSVFYDHPTYSFKQLDVLVEWVYGTEYHSVTLDADWSSSLPRRELILPFVAAGTEFFFSLDTSFLLSPQFYTGPRFRMAIDINPIKEIPLSPPTTHNELTAIRHYWSLAVDSQSLVINVDLFEGPALTVDLYLSSEEMFAGVDPYTSIICDGPTDGCLLEFPSTADLLADTVYVEVSQQRLFITDPPIAMSVYDISASVGSDQNCIPISTAIPSSSFCNANLPSEYLSQSISIWDYEDLSDRPIQAESRYQTLANSWCPTPSDECRAALATFACVETYRPCSSSGFTLPLCQDYCIDVVEACASCGHSDWENVNNYLPNSITRLEWSCGSSRYVVIDGSETEPTCSGFIPLTPTTTTPTTTSTTTSSSSSSSSSSSVSTVTTTSSTSTSTTTGTTTSTSTTGGVDHSASSTLTISLLLIVSFLSFTLFL